MKKFLVVLGIVGFLAASAFVPGTQDIAEDAYPPLFGYAQQS
ncbi:hypothetical protein [Halobacillus salinus]|nr:hypothetical protein [Halobacillus salinus]